METSLAHWEFLKPTDIAEASEAVSRYLDMQQRFVLFANGTALVLKPELDNEQVINGAMDEIKMKRDFNVMPMKDGNFTVSLANPVIVFLSASETKEIVSAVRSIEAKRIAEGLQDGEMSEHTIIGFAGREKAHRDAEAKKQVFRFVPNA